jgi:hypothetical protein
MNGAKISLRMICSERAVGHNPWAEAFVLCPAGPIGLSPGFPPRFQPLGIARQERRALKGRQIERPNKAEANPIVQLSHVPIVYSDFCAAIGASFIWYPHLLPLPGETFILRVPRVETLG